MGTSVAGVPGTLTRVGFQRRAHGAFLDDTVIEMSGGSTVEFLSLTRFSGHLLRCFRQLRLVVFRADVAKCRMAASIVSRDVVYESRLRCDG